MSFFGHLGKATDDINKLATRPNVRNFAGKVKLSEGAPVDPSVKGDAFRPERSYFSVKVVEMRLAEAGRYFTDFVPMCSCFLRYTYGHSLQTLPFVLGSDTISAGLGVTANPLAAKNIQFQDVHIVRNVPVKADNLTMYTALCRFKDTGFARNLLDLLADTAGLAGGPVVGAAVKTGVDLTKRLATLLGTDGVETRFGMLNGSALDESGYRMFAGAVSANLNAMDLSINGGQLVRQVNGTEQTVDDADYLVLALEYRQTLVDENFAQVSILPFHARFEEARAKLFESDKTGANAALRQLFMELATSPDVTEADRLALITSYRGAFDQWADATSGKAITMGGTTLGGTKRDEAKPIVSRFPIVRRPELSTLIGTAQAATVATDGRLRRVEPQPDANDSAAVNKGLAERAIAVANALQQTNTTEEALAQASLTVLQAMF